MTHPISEKKLDVAALVERLQSDLVIQYAVPIPVAEELQRAANERGEAAIALTALTKKVGELEAALRAIAEYQWPVIAGYHEYTTTGEATGEQYTHKMAVPKESGGGALKSVQRIARAALNDTTQCRESDNG